MRCPRLTARHAAVLLAAVMSVTTVIAAGQRASTRPYFPPRGEWQKKDPAAAGLDKVKVEEAIAFARAHENPDTKDLAAAIVKQFQAEAPYNTLIGPTQPRAASNGPRQRWRASETYETSSDYAR
jgi:hypothetical protein